MQTLAIQRLRTLTTILLSKIIQEALLGGGLKFRVSRVGDSVTIKGEVEAYRYELFGDASNFEIGETNSAIISLVGDNSSTQKLG